MERSRPSFGFHKLAAACPKSPAESVLIHCGTKAFIPEPYRFLTLTSAVRITQISIIYLLQLAIKLRSAKVKKLIESNLMIICLLKRISISLECRGIVCRFLVSFGW